MKLLGQIYKHRAAQVGVKIKYPQGCRLECLTVSAIKNMAAYGITGYMLFCGRDAACYPHPLGSQSADTEKQVQGCAGGGLGLSLRLRGLGLHVECG